MLTIWSCLLCQRGHWDVKIWINCHQLRCGCTHVMNCVFVLLSWSNTHSQFMDLYQSSSKNIRGILGNQAMKLGNVRNYSCDFETHGCVHSRCSAGLTREFLLDGTCSSRSVSRRIVHCVASVCVCMQLDKHRSSIFVGHCTGAIFKWEEMPNLQLKTEASVVGCLESQVTRLERLDILLPWIGACECLSVVNSLKSIKQPARPLLNSS